MNDESPKPDMHVLDGSIDTIGRWRRELLEITGCSSIEIDRKIDALAQFCDRHEISAKKMVDECRHGADRGARLAFYLRAAGAARASLVVQSYLIHNGVNIFGELVCIPATLEAVRKEQGEQWLPGRRRYS